MMRIYETNPGDKEGDFRIVEDRPGKYEIQQCRTTFWKGTLYWYRFSGGSWFGDGPEDFDSKHKKLADYYSQIRHSRRVVEVWRAGEASAPIHQEGQNR